MHDDHRRAPRSRSAAGRLWGRQPLRRAPKDEEAHPQPHGTAPPRVNEHLLKKLRIILSQIRGEAHGQRRKENLVELANELDAALSDAFEC